MIIVVTALPFWRANRGALQRVLAQIQTLKEKVEVKVCYVGQINYFDSRALGRLKLSNIVESIYNFKPSSTNIKIGDLPKSLRSTVSIDFASRFQSYANYNKSATFVFHNIDLHYLKSGLRHGQNSILDMHDIRSNRGVGFKNAGREPETNISRDEELAIFKTYDSLIAIQNTDKSDLVNWGLKSSKIITCGHMVECNNHYDNNDVVNIGYMGSHNISNIDAIKWFVNDVWPAYSASGIKLNIYGDVCKHISGLNSEGVVKHGLIPNIETVYVDNQIIINPVLYGSGLKIKNVEAMSMGRPLITTDEGARGLEKYANESFLLVNSAYEFIEAIECLVQSLELRSAISGNGLDVVDKYYSKDESYRELLELVEADSYA
ncbi:MAG: glycosyltransferase [Colwellia sp.]|jgi:hypothetical protein